MVKDMKTKGIYAGIFVGAFVISLGYCFLLHSLGAFGGDSGFYVAEAKEILSGGPAYYASHIATPYYWGYPTFLAVCMAVVGENWTAVALVQIFLSAVSTVLLFQVIKDVTESTGQAAGLALFYKIIMDVSMWDGRILSDSLGMTLECMTLYFFYMGMRDKKRRDYILFAVSAVLFFMTRTNSISLLIVLLGTVFLALPKKKRRVIGTFIALILVIAAAGLFIVGDNEAHGLGSRVEYFRDYYLQGNIVSGRPEYSYKVPAGHVDSPLFLWDIVLMILLKAIYYWSIYFKGYSMVHILICFVTILPTFLLTLFSIICIIKDKVKQLYPFVAGIASYSFIQICTEVDFDMRYRAPIFLLCMICSGYGVKKLCLLMRDYRNEKI